MSPLIASSRSNDNDWTIDGLMGVCGVWDRNADRERTSPMRRDRFAKKIDRASE